MAGYIRFLDCGELFDFSHVIFGLAFVVLFFWRLLLGNDVFRRVGISKPVFFFGDNKLVEVLHGIHIEKSSVPLVSNSATVCDLGYQISDSLPWGLLDNLRLFAHN